MLSYKNDEKELGGIRSIGKSAGRVKTEKSRDRVPDPTVTLFIFCVFSVNIIFNH